MGNHYKPMKALKQEKIRLIYALGHELKYMRAKLELARVLAKFPDKKKSFHPVINFAFSHAQTAVIEWLILRFNEAITVFLNPASRQILGKPLYEGKKGSYRSKIKAITSLMEFRHLYIAHHMANLDPKNARFQEIIVNCGDIFNFLSEIIDILEDIINQLRDKGIYDDVDGLSASYPVIEQFAERDIDKLIAAANSLVKKNESDKKRQI